MPASRNIVQVPSKDYKALEELLKAKLPSSGLIYNVLKLGQSLNENGKIYVKIYADNITEEWGINKTTFMGVSNVQGFPNNLVVFSGPKTGPSKDTILSLLAKLDWKRKNQFEGIENSIAPVLIEEAKKHGTVVEHDPIGLYYMTKAEALNILTEKDFKTLAGPHIRGGSLHPKDAAMVQDRWPEKQQGYYEMLEASIEQCSSGGIYVSKEETSNITTQTDSWDLVSFAVALPFGSIHALHTEPKHRRKGYGALTMKILAQNIAKADRIPLVQIFLTNDSSLSLNEGIGFKYSHEINLINFTPN